MAREKKGPTGRPAAEALADMRGNLETEGQSANGQPQNGLLSEAEVKRLYKWAFLALCKTLGIDVPQELRDRIPAVVRVERHGLITADGRMMSVKLGKRSQLVPVRE